MVKHIPTATRVMLKAEMAVLLTLKPSEVSKVAGSIRKLAMVSAYYSICFWRALTLLLSAMLRCLQALSNTTIQVNMRLYMQPKL